MIKQVEYKKRYAAHYIQLGEAYVRQAMLSFDGEEQFILEPFDREYPSTIFLSGTILIYPKGDNPKELKQENEISIEEMQTLLNAKPNSWSIKLP